MEGAVLDLYNKAVASYDRGAYEIDIQEYEKDLELEPENVDILVNLGAVCLQKRRADKAIDYFSRALTIAPNNSMALYDIGKAYMYKQDFRLAYMAFQQASELLPEDLEIKQLMVECLRSLGKYKDAVALMLQNIDKFSTNIDALMELGGDLKMLARYEEALEIYRKASDAACNSIEPLKGMYDCHIHLNNKDKAQITLKRALMIEPSNQEVILRLVDLYLEENKVQEAVETITKGLETIESPVLLREKYNEMVRRLPVLKKKSSPNKFVPGQSSHESEVFDILDKLYDGKIQIETALKDMGILHKKEPEDVLIADEYANLLYQTRQFEKASEVYSELYISRPNSPVHRVDLAKSQAMNGDVEAARTTLTDAIRDLGHQAELDLALVELDLLEKNFEKAGARLDMIAKEYPDDVHGLFLYAYTAFRMDKLDIAESTFEKLLELASDDEEVAMWYSRFAIMTGKPEKALKVWDSFNDGIDSFVEIMCRIELTIASGDTSQIMKLLCKIGDYKPRFIEDHLMFGKAFFYAGEFPSAQREFDIVLKAEPHNAEALGMTAVNSLMRNKMAQFSSIWQRAIYLDTLYAILPMMVLKECMKFIPKEKLKSETKKLLNIATLSAPDYARLKRLYEAL